MSFNQNGSQRRYGHVPPAQYGPPGSQDLNSNMQRRPSFNNGDDAALNHGQGFPGRTASLQEERYMASPNTTSPRSPTHSAFGNNTQTFPVLSGYQHQYQPEDQHSPPLVQQTYNPQAFARAQSQSSQYRPQPTPTYGNTPGYAGHQPYNPAAYSPVASPQRQATSAGYGSYTPSYSTSSLPQPPQSPTYWPGTQGPPVPPRPTSSQHAPQYASRPTSQAEYNQPYNPSYVPSHSASLSSRHAEYYQPPSSSSYSNGYGLDDNTTPTSSQAPYPSDDAFTAIPAPSYADEENSFANRTKRYSTGSHHSGGAITSPGLPQGSPGATGLQRHPTLRPLPSAPVGDDTDEEDWGFGSHGKTEEEIAQEKLFADIDSAVNVGSSRSRHGSGQNGDLLDGELRRYNSTRTTLNPTDPEHSMAAITSYETIYDDYDDANESDVEAAAGLEAMRLAEEQEAQLGSGGLTFGTYESHPAQISSKPLPPQPQDESSDSDYKNMDLGLAGGGYDAHMSYGAHVGGLATGNSSEMEDQSRPLPTPDEIGRSDIHQHQPTPGLGGMTDYSIPGETTLHPFPAFEDARVDTFGTGGLQRPTSQSHRLSFDEGDEQVSLHSRNDSRLSNLSGSESPTRDDMPELFYHPGMSSSPYNRPLPAVPPLSSDTIPQLMPAGSYMHNYSGSFSTGERPAYLNNGTGDYSPQTMLSPGGAYVPVPRSTSLSSHSSTPVTVPPVRSKTDAEERQARAKAARGGVRSASGLDGFDATTPQTAMSLDLPSLPAGRRKKFSPSRLSSADFKKCQEPWALSGIATWIREMAGGDTGEGEADLRTKTIEEGLVALFTHKVPTMNTADAEILSSRIVKSMLDDGLLVPEEEWVKFGQGEISGVLWQLTGSGCYAPKLHEQEIPGRCYSHHCTRTLKKINLQSQTLEPSKKSEDWVTFFKLTKEQLEGAHKKEIERQNNLHEIVMSEDLYMDHINVLRIIYRDELAAWNPPIIDKKKISKFLASVFGKVEAIKEVNENYLLAQLKYRQKEQGPWVVGFSDIFREWIRKARAAYIEYAAGFPYATYLVRREAEKNLLFRQFLDQARENKMSNRLDWNTYLKAPITRLQRYTLLLGTVLKNMTQDTEEKVLLATAIEEIKAVTLECDAKVDEQAKKVEMIELQSKLFLRPGMERVELNLDHLGRELIFKGDLQRAGTNRFTWLDTHAILFDHYLVLAKTVVQRDASGVRKKEVYDVSKLPIPMQLLVLESTNDDPVVKSSVKGIGAVTSVAKPTTGSSADARLMRPATNGDRPSPLEHTNTGSSASSMSMVSVTRISTNPTGEADKSMYPFRVKHLGKADTYTLYAPSAQNRQDWCEKILEAKTRHAASLFAQNAEPFRLRVMADTAFGNNEGFPSRNTVVSVKGTPLDRSIRDIERVFGSGPRPGPVCRAMVNCATAFNSYGKSMVAIGTDYGVYTAEAGDTRGWTKAIQISRVTQIAVLEEFSLCLIIADKSLIAYHLDVIVPVSSFPAPQHDSARKAPQKLSGNRDVSFFSTARMKDRTLVFYKKREGLHSTFKVLEPVFQKSTEKKTRLFGKKFGGNTEFFREFDEFYIPTECFTINLFHTYIAISTLKGFELMTLDKKTPISIPDTKNPAIGSIAARLQGQKPLGMFRLSDAEFLLCYEECGVYVDKHGEISRGVVMEFVGKAKTAAMYGAYLVLFDSDFVEVRNAENGRLRQVVAGREVRCLDYGINPQGGGGQVDTSRTLKLAMAHPEISSNQIVLELVLNDGHTE
ncbi:RhoGEF protein-like protein [Coleophoma cylindrospora]|uniref:RhoGEF protein-like protein n=1 Tax=Coleophoma cylindrospora TaxID=1849047 RepID=A0A3D8QKL2_9HELO|nr:RhoGEF protein-like protein [Coleophoma cylindrospora]